MPTKLTGLLNRYFYLFMSLLIAGVVVYGFSQRIDRRLIHPSHRTPLLLSIHAAIFSAWVIFYIVQCALIRSTAAHCPR